MQTNDKILVKDPYLNKTFLTESVKLPPYMTLPPGQPGLNNGINSKWKMEQDVRREL